MADGKNMYLDYNATTPVDPRVLAAMQPYWHEVFGNPHSRDHRYGWDAAEAVEASRAQVAALIGAAPHEIVFTSGGTESINQALRGLNYSTPNGRAGIITFAAEHEAVLATCRDLTVRWLVPHTTVPMLPDGSPCWTALQEALQHQPCCVVALMAANNETGDVYDVQRAARIAHEHGALLLCDAVQAAGKMLLDVRAMEVDMLALSAHKLYGPKGVGALYVRGGTQHIQLAPLLTGGGQECGLRSGTLNMPGIVGFGAACHWALREMAEATLQLGRHRDRLETALVSDLPDVSINGGRRDRLPNTSNLCFHGVEARALIRDMHEVCVSTRSACSSSSAGPSHVLKALGLSDDDAYSSIRFSVGRRTTDAEIDMAVEKVLRSVRKLRQLQSISY